MGDERTGWRRLFGSKSRSERAEPTELILLKESFEDQIDQSIADIESRRRAASRVVRGSATRTQVILAEVEALEEFSREVSRRANERSLARLPRVIDALGNPIAQAHKLIVGPWQACFLVSLDGSAAFGLTFSRGAPDWATLTRLIDQNKGGDR